MYLNINKSLLLLCIFAVTYLGAAFMVSLLAINIFVQILLWLVLGYGLYDAYGRHAWRTSPRSIQALDMNQDGEVSVRVAASTEWKVAEIKSRFISPWLMLLVLHIEGQGQQSVVVPVDAVAIESFRRWRVALQFQSVSEPKSYPSPAPVGDGRDRG